MCAQVCQESAKQLCTDSVTDYSEKWEWQKRIVMNNLEMILGWKMYFARTKGWFTSLFHSSIILMWVIFNIRTDLIRSDWCILQCESHFQLEISFSSQQGGYLQIFKVQYCCLFDGLLEKVNQGVQNVLYIREQYCGLWYSK